MSKFVSIKSKWSKMSKFVSLTSNSSEMSKCVTIAVSDRSSNEYKLLSSPLVSAPSNECFTLFFLPVDSCNSPFFRVPILAFVWNN